MYVLYSIISPTITKLTGNSIQVSDIVDLEQYIETASKPKSKEEHFETVNQGQIYEVYLASLKNDIKEKVMSKGYEVENLEVLVQNKEQYTIQQISLTVQKKEKEEKQEEQNAIGSVETINITVGSHQNTQKKEEKKENKLSQKEKAELQDYLSTVYDINQKNIVINK